MKPGKNAGNADESPQFRTGWMHVVEAFGRRGKENVGVVLTTVNMKIKCLDSFSGDGYFLTFTWREHCCCQPMPEPCCMRT